MASFSHWLKLCPLFLILTSGMCLNLVKKKGSPAQVTCTSREKDSTMTWQMRIGNDYVNVSDCNIAKKTCVDSMPNQYHGEVGPQLKVQFYITSVRTNETEIRCYYTAHYGGNFHLEVYEEPSQPVCEAVTVDYSRRNLLFKCLVGNVYPSVDASLNIRGVNLHENDIVSHYCSNKKNTSADSDTFIAECTWRVSASRLEPITYIYHVKVLPHVSENSTDKIQGVVSKDMTLGLSSPTAVIDHKNCPVGSRVRNGKIEVGSTATCRCMLDIPGFPPGQANWFDGKNVPVGRGNISDHSSTLMIYGVKSGASYQCRADSVLISHLKLGPIYTPEFYDAQSSTETARVQRHEAPKSEYIVGIVIGCLALLSVAAFAIWIHRQGKKTREDIAAVLYRHCDE